MLQVVARFGICRDTVAVLKFLLELALTGQLRGLALCYRTAEGKDEVLFTGVHDRRPESALGAASQMHVVAANRIELPH